ncbi:hypothetical protein LMG7974_00533 [Campylobacter majalis]|uniref:Uncharacterized protein n=1 Tax=Campylobacter majalis TaxID=2790656 RepID=A0ABM8Q4D4_9BACT|nr:hypothetical protein [Campylobacter majalis]CAD7287653.1 hypothetical protein LMG7974_00533 [Campylobacter majalis]
MFVFLKLLKIFLIYAMLPIIVISCIYIDFKLFKFDHIGELSLTEISQEITVFIICAIYFLLAKYSRNFNSLSILIFGFFATILVREFDYVFDMMHHGSWVFAALMVAIICIFFACKSFKILVKELDEYIKTQSFYLMLCGIVCVFVFSRVFGSTKFWDEFLLLSDAKMVKNIVQEGIELFGYLLCLMSSFLFKTEKFSQN